MVLHYHSLGELPREQDPHNLMVGTGEFRTQLASLRRRGYEFLTITEFAARLDDDGGQPPGRICSLTFDDGTTDNLDLLPAILEEFDANATVFVCPGLLGQRHADYAPEAEIRILSRVELSELAADPRIEIGSHTTSHDPLDEATFEDALQEMTDSKIALEEMLGQEVTSFAYPSCGYSDACPDAARSAGYAVAVTCGSRGAWLPFELERESLTSLDGRTAFALKSRRLWSSMRGSLLGRVGSWWRWGRGNQDDEALR